MPVTLTSVWKGDAVYDHSVKEFHQNWDTVNKGPCPHIYHIFKVSHYQDDAAAHEAAHHAYVQRVGNVQYLFHGTKRTCRIGDHRDWVTPCNDTGCSLCGILKISFDFHRAGSVHGAMFGDGVYTTSVTSKAVQYSQSTNSDSNICLISHIAVGNTYLAMQADSSLTGPPSGFDSVTGATYAQGGSLIYPETVVYVPEAICVGALVVFKDQ